MSDKSETPLDWEKTEFQNQMQIIDYNHWAAALYSSLHITLYLRKKKADEIEYKYLNEVFNDYFGFISNFIFEKEVGKTVSGSTTFSLSNYFYLKDFNYRY